MKEKFIEASEKVKTLKTRPSNEMLLQLYAHYKQATEGDVKGSRPGVFDLKGRAKFDAWASIKGTSEEMAMKNYIALVDKLFSCCAGH